MPETDTRIVNGSRAGRGRGGRLAESAIHQALEAALGTGRIRRDLPLGPFTTFRVGGNADWFVDVRRENEIAAAVAVAARLDLPMTVLGGGSNVLVSDTGVRGLVVRTRHGDIRVRRPGVVRASAGVTLNGLVRWTVSRGLGGVEAWAGTPGTVGGAVRGNAHFDGRLIGEVVSAVGVAGPDGTVRSLRPDEMGFGYDRSRLERTGEVAVWAEFAVAAADPAVLRASARASLRFRKRTQPLDVPSAGCIFQNPDPGRVRLPDDVPCSAGALVDRAGLKGGSIGSARVSDVHGNFIVTHGKGSARDIRSLIELCRAEVAARFGVTLTPEIVFLGEFEYTTR